MEESPCWLLFVGRKKVFANQGSRWWGSRMIGRDYLIVGLFRISARTRLLPAGGRVETFNNLFVKHICWIFRSESGCQIVASYHLILWSRFICSDCQIVFNILSEQGKSLSQYSWTSTVLSKSCWNNVFFFQSYLSAQLFSTNAKFVLDWGRYRLIEPGESANLWGMGGGWGL